jgi:hypothetical protein
MCNLLTMEARSSFGRLQIVRVQMTWQRWTSTVSRAQPHMQTHAVHNRRSDRHVICHERIVFCQAQQQTDRQTDSGREELACACAPSGALNDRLISDECCCSVYEHAISKWITWTSFTLSHGTHCFCVSVSIGSFEDSRNFKSLYMCTRVAAMELA